jgi:hypothetical protein
VNVSEQPSDHTRIWSKLSGNCSKFNCNLLYAPENLTSFDFTQEVQQEVVVELKQDKQKEISMLMNRAESKGSAQCEYRKTRLLEKMLLWILVCMLTVTVCFSLLPFLVW